MIKITYSKNDIYIKGHSLPDICSAISTATYITANNLISLQKSGIDNGKCTIEDNLEDDYMHIKIEKHSKITDILVETLITGFEDIVEEYPNFVQIKKDS